MLKAFDFRDVLIVPKKSYIKSPKDVCLLRNIKIGRIPWVGTPIIAESVTNMDRFKILRQYGYMACFGKEMIDEWTKMDYLPADLGYTKSYMLRCGLDFTSASIIIDWLKEYSACVNFLCIDVENGYTQDLQDVCCEIKRLYPDIVLIAGNVCTPDLVEELIIDCGVNIVKCGTTSSMLKNGVGFTQLSTVMDCSKAAHDCGGYIISDGGITHPGDVVKAFAAGADFVMTRQNPEDINEVLRTACSYVNATNLSELRKNSEFVYLK